MSTQTSDNGKRIAKNTLLFLYFLNALDDSDLYKLTV